MAVCGLLGRRACGFVPVIGGLPCLDLYCTCGACAGAGEGGDDAPEFDVTEC